MKDTQDALKAPWKTPPFASSPIFKQNKCSGIYN